MVAELAERLAARLPGRVDRDVPLRRFTTYRLGGPAQIYVEPRDVDDLVVLGEELAREPQRAPVLAVGRGSNLVVSDRGWPGVAVRLGAGFSYIEDDGDEGLRAGGASALPQVANRAARRGLHGMEFAIAIPGSVGGAVRMNAGAHGREVSDCLSYADVYDLVNLRRDRRDVARLDLAYRHSNLAPDDVVISAVFRLDRGDPNEVRERMESYRRHRAETQPGAVQNAGSVFRNPPGDHAGRLVEASGLKGHRVGGASVSALHANFFIAEEGSTAQDVYDLVHQVRSLVREAHGVDLVPEIRFVGHFDGARADG
ncbi:MAG TPA: UDP-N-acetylmuramate dehydrogenase [Actinomycetota bacterium]|nr:UDP-N-acetylmuramate dehydrogenase [Actinomycetota bacterium]